MHSGKSSDTDIAYLSFNDLVLLLFMFLVTLSMLTDSAGCYNVREKKAYCTPAYLYRQFLPELPPSPYAEKVYAFSDIFIYTNTISRGL